MFNLAAHNGLLPPGHGAILSPARAAGPPSSSPSALSSPTCRGYGDEWIAGGNDRLSERYLDTGALSFDVYAIRDKFSGYIVAMQSIPSMHDPDALAHVFLDAVEEEQGAAANIVVGNGAENHLLLQTQVTLHTQSGAPPGSTTLYEFGTPNVSLRGLWTQWMRIHGRALQIAIQDEAGPAGFDPSDYTHLLVGLYVWRTVIQRSLDNLRNTMNMSPVHSSQSKKAAGLPSGHTPTAARRGFAGGQRCIVPCDLGAVRRLRDEDVGSRATFVDPEFDEAALSACREMGNPALSRANAWAVWAELVRRMS
ncbi:hypothetical protein JCM9279_003534 [Rhodotorula babjevae]